MMLRGFIRYASNAQILESFQNSPAASRMHRDLMLPEPFPE